MSELGERALREVLAHGRARLPADGLAGQALPLALTPQGPVHYSPLAVEAAAALLASLLTGKPQLRGFLLCQQGRRLLLSEYDHERRAFALCLELDADPPIGPRQRLSPLAARSALS